MPYFCKAVSSGTFHKWGYVLDLISKDVLQSDPIQQVVSAGSFLVLRVVNITALKNFGELCETSFHDPN
jgi:hypothetical protein